MNLIQFIILFTLLTSQIFAKETLTNVSLQLLWKHQFEFAGFYMAKEKGFYEEAGLDVDFKEFQIGQDISQDVVEGKSDFGVGYSGIILDKLQGANIKLLNAIYQSSPHVLVSLESSGINSIQDFKNKRISMTDSHSKTANIKSMIYSQNVNMEEMIPVPYEYSIEKILEKKVDIISVYLSNEVFILKEKNIPYKIWDPKNYGFSFYDNILFTSETFIKNDPETVKKFQKASLMGWEYALNNIDETIEIVYEKYNTLKKSKKALLYEAQELKKLAYYKTNQVGKIDPNKIQRIIDIYTLLGLAKNSVDIDQFIYDPNTHKIELTQDEKEYIKSHAVIRIANEQFSPPFNFQSNNEPKGLSVDFINLLTSKLGLSAQFVSVQNSQEILDKVQRKEIDVVLNVIQTPSRENELLFTPPYAQSQKAIFTNQENIDSIEKLEGKKVAVVKGNFIHSYLLTHHPKIKIIEKNSFYETISAVLQNEADALIGEYSIIDYLLNESQHFIRYSSFLDEKIFSKDIHLGIRKELHILHSILQKASYAVLDDEKKQLNGKWLGNHQENLEETIKLSPAEKEHLKKKHTITMCIDPNWMPFEKLQNNTHIGMSADYFKLFEKKLGKEIKVIPTISWEQSIEFAKQRKCDLLSLAMETPQRKEYLNFTTPYLKVPLVVATKNDVTFINDFKALSNKRVGIPKGYAFVEILRNKYPYIEITEVENLKDGLERVRNGELFGYIGTLASVGYMLQKEFIGELKIAGKFDEQWELGIGVRNDDTILLNIMQKLVESINITQSQAILNNWLAIKYEQKVDYKFLWQILAFVAMILFFIIYRQYILYKSNKNLQKLVEEKTKELTELNKSLEEKIKEKVDELRQKDKILYEQSKMAAMGEMIGNISHQWRQPLSIISTAASGMKVKIELDIFDKEDEIESLDIITNAAQYLSNTIEDFRNFLNPNQESFPFNIKKVFDKTLFMFGNNFKEQGIKVIVNISDEEIYGNENELLQVIINILNNAKDAFIERNISYDRYIFIDITHLKHHLCITIQDNGGGIDEKYINNIFEPYFTTKHKSMGTGIGLYMSYQIIHNKFGGNIIATNKTFDYENKTYKGANFEIILPTRKV